MDARRSLLKVRTHWYPIMQQLHVALDHDGKRVLPLTHLSGTKGGGRKVRRNDIRVHVDLASLPGPHGFLNGHSMKVHGGCIAGADIAA